MGVGVSALGNSKDQDEKLLDEQMIEEVSYRGGGVEGGSSCSTTLSSRRLTLPYFGLISNSNPHHRPTNRPIKALGFYRKWSMGEVKHIMNKFQDYKKLKGLADLHAYEAAQKSTNHVNDVHPETMKQAFDLRVSWAEFYELGELVFSHDAPPLSASC